MTEEDIDNLISTADLLTVNRILDRKRDLLVTERERLLAEKSAWLRQYDRDIETINTTLHTLGVYLPLPVAQTITPAAEAVVDLLRRHAGQWLSNATIQQEVPTTGVLSVMLKQHLDAGVIDCRGRGRGSQYMFIVSSSTSSEHSASAEPSNLPPELPSSSQLHHAAAAA